MQYKGLGLSVSPRQTSGAIITIQKSTALFLMGWMPCEVGKQKILVF